MLTDVDMTWQKQLNFWNMSCKKSFIVYRTCQPLKSKNFPPKVFIWTTGPHINSHYLSSHKKIWHDLTVSVVAGLDLTWCQSTPWPTWHTTFFFEIFFILTLVQLLTKVFRKKTQVFEKKWIFSKLRKLVKTHVNFRGVRHQYNSAWNGRKHPVFSKHRFWHVFRPVATLGKKSKLPKKLPTNQRLIKNPTLTELTVLMGTCALVFR